MLRQIDEYVFKRKAEFGTKNKCYNRYFLFIPIGFSFHTKMRAIEKFKSALSGCAVKFDDTGI